MVRRPWPVGLALAVLVGAMGVWWAWGLPTALDLNPDDEALYIARGLRWAAGEGGLPRAWGPLYSLWYAGLSRLVPPEEAYDVTLALTTWLPPALLAWVAWRQTQRAAPALLAGMAFLVSTTNAGAWRVGHFALLLALAGWLAWPRRAPGPFAWLGQALAAWAVSWVRPEFALSAAALVAVAAGSAWQAARRAGRWPRRVALALVAVAVLVLLTYPERDPQGRAWAAFGQHFAVRWKARTHAAFNPYHDWPQVLEEAFGPGVHSWLAAWRARPALMLWFVARNGLGWGKSVLQGLTPYPWRAHWPWAIGALLLAVAVLVGAQRRGRAPTLAWWVWAGAWALPGVAAAWLVYPRPHYRVVPLALGWLALTHGLAGVWPGGRAWRGSALAAALLVALVVPRPYRQPQPRPLYATVRALRAALPPTGRGVAVAAHGHAALLYLADRVQVRQPPLETAVRPWLVYPWPWPVEAPPFGAAGEPALTGCTPRAMPDGSTWLVCLRPRP